MRTVMSLISSTWKVWLFYFNVCTRIFCAYETIKITELNMYNTPTPLIPQISEHRKRTVCHHFVTSLCCFTMFQCVHALIARGLAFLGALQHVSLLSLAVTGPASWLLHPCCFEMDQHRLVSVAMRICSEQQPWLPRGHVEDVQQCGRAAAGVCLWWGGGSYAHENIT